MLEIPCIIFAGGKSSRMGEDKALLPFSSYKTLTEFQLSRLQKIFKTVYISCRNRDKFDFNANFIEDIQKGDIFAPTLGFVSIFEEIKENKFFAISVDTPFVSIKEIKKLLEFDGLAYDTVIAKTEEGVHPLCGIYSRSLQKNFEDMVLHDNHRLGLLLKSANTKYVDFSDSKAFLNLNHPSDYQKALTLI